MNRMGGGWGRGEGEKEYKNKKYHKQCFITGVGKPTHQI
jgi:hypothetical protein